jgi:hypothetical protein
MEITANCWPIDKERNIKLIPLNNLKDLPKGTKLFTVGGIEVEVGKDELDTQTRVFKKSKYGKLIE